MWIRALGDYSDTVDTDELPALRQLVREALGAPVRRIGRFIQLALIGAGRCMGEQALPAQTAVYLGSGRGDLDVTLEVVNPLFREGLPPKPLSFVNTVSNATNFYIAKHFGLAGRSNFVCNRFFAFEAALELAMQDIRLGYTDSVLVGSVDLVTASLHQHRARLELPPEHPVAEGSHWLWLVGGAQPEDAVAEVQLVRQFDDLRALLGHLHALNLSSERSWLLPGNFVDAASIAEIQTTTGLTPVHLDAREPGYYDSRAGGAISAFLSQPDGDTLLHINRETDGERFCLMQVRRISRVS